MPAIDQIYASESTVAKMLGHGVDWLRSNQTTLESQYGFPKIDPAIGKRHIPSIKKWAAERNAARVIQQPETVNAKVNIDAL